MHFEIVDGAQLSPLSPPQRDAIAACVYSAMSDFLDLYVGGLEAFADVLGRWWDREDSAFFREGCRVATGAEGEVLGCYFSMPGAELGPRQMADFMNRMRSCDRAERQRLSSTFSEMSKDELVVSPDAEYLLVIGVLPQYQGQGVGGALMKDYLERGRLRGVSGSELTVDVTNSRARAIYDALGFEPTAVLGNRVTGITVDVMRRPS